MSNPSSESLILDTEKLACTIRDNLKVRNLFGIHWKVKSLSNMIRMMHERGIGNKEFHETAERLSEVRVDALISNMQSLLSLMPPKDVKGS